MRCVPVLPAICSQVVRWLVFAFVTLAAIAVTTTPTIAAESPADAIARMRSGRHAPIPPPRTAHASGPAGKGITIENGTGYPLHVYFSGPVSRTV